MKRLLTLAVACALAGVAFAGCAKSSGSDAGAASTTGPITDSGSTGLKPAAEEASLGAGDPAHGQAIFTQNCSSCHGAKGEGGVGPSLKGEKSRKNYGAAVVWIKNPKPPMPKLYPNPLGEKDVEDVAAFVETL